MKGNQLTGLERYVVSKILEEAKRSLVYNEDEGEYHDDGSFILALEKDEMAVLTRAIKKI